LIAEGARLLLYLLVTLWRWHRERIQPERIEIAGLYWHFLDLVWVFISTPAGPDG
jgi:heme/copper-type cytochrome/quinol oxidase subunit 3